MPVVGIVLQILLLTLSLCILIIDLTLYTSLAMLAHRNILLIWISATLTGRLLAQSQLPLSLNIDVHSVPLPLILLLILVLAISFVSLHDDSLLIVTASLKYLLCSSHAHVFLSNVVVCSLQNIS